MNKGHIPDKDFKKLYDAIVNSIVNSDEVQKIIFDLKEKNKINSISIIALIMRLEELLTNSTLPLKAQKTVSVPNKKEEVKRLKKSSTGVYIDGTELTKNQIEFEEFCRQNFDEINWLKENRIRFY